jgi:hypothetical protein
VVAAALLTSGCPSSSADTTNDVDRQRAEVLRGEPIYATAERPPVVDPGWVTFGRHDWHRPNTTGALARWEAGDDAAADGERRTASALTALRDNGWTVLWARCTPPVSISGSAPPAVRPSGGPKRVWSPEGWTWHVVGYRVRDGVSYWFELYGVAVPAHSGTLDLYLVAPNHLDSADLFPDRPAGLPAGGTCIERPGQPAPSAPAEVDGTYFEIERHHAAKVESRDPAFR